jgi:hypothetical protein
MRKQMILTMLLSGFLCTSGFVQRAEIFGEAQDVDLQSSVDAALTGNFEDARENAAESGAIEGGVNSCANARAIRLDTVVWERDGQHVLEVPFWHLPDSQTFFVISRMAIDADGAPNAYNPEDTGLDELANAGSPAHWNGIIIDEAGVPLIQQESDPYPGYYISCTSLYDKNKKFTDPTGYVDASRVPYVAFPQDLADRIGLQLGNSQS